MLAENLLRAAGLSGDDLKSLAHVFKDASAHFAVVSNRAVLLHLMRKQAVEAADDAAFNAIMDKAAIIAPLKADRWGCTLYVTADATLVFSMIEAMFGAQGNLGSFDLERPFGMLERKISSLLTSHMAAALDQVFSNNARRCLLLANAQTRLSSTARNSSVRASSFAGSMWSRQAKQGPCIFFCPAARTSQCKMPWLHSCAVRWIRQIPPEQKNAQRSQPRTD